MGGLWRWGSAKGQAFSKWTWLKTSRPSENAIVTSHASSSLPISTAPKLFCHDFEPEHPNVGVEEKNASKCAIFWKQRWHTAHHCPANDSFLVGLQASDSCNRIHHNVEVTKENENARFIYYQPSLNIINNLLKLTNHCSSCWNWVLSTIRLNL